MANGQLLCPTAGAVFMLLRSAMSAAAGHAISPFMLSACVGAGLTIPWCHSLLSYLDGALCNRRISAAPSVYVADFNSAAYNGQRRLQCRP